MKPRIAVSFPNSKKADYVKRALPQYEHALRAAGADPVVIPIETSNAEIAQAVKTCDGVLLPGSPADVDPEKYGATRDPNTAEADPARDNLDELLLQDAYNMRKPVFGICYGLQSLNVWRTGTLIQHLAGEIKHNAGSKVMKAHEVEIEPGSKLAKILQSRHVALRDGALTVNSSHHQSAGILGDGLNLAAVSARDKVVEAVEGSSPDHFVLAVQWHPERTFDSDTASRALFQAFVHAAADWHARLAKTSADFETIVPAR